MKQMPSFNSNEISSNLLILTNSINEEDEEYKGDFEAQANQVLALEEEKKASGNYNNSSNLLILDESD